MSDRTSDGTDAGPTAAAGAPAAGAQPPVPSAAALTRAVPSFAVILLADAAAVWAAVSGSWTALVVVIVCVIDGLADGIFAWLRARASFAAGSATDKRDDVLVREFLRTYLVVIGAQAIVAYMVFSGILLRPGGERPVEPGAAFVTWQFWAVIAALVVMRAAVYWWDFVRGGEASVIPPAAVVSEPLRRLFVLQFGVLAGTLVVYWFFDSSVTGLAVILVAKAVADLMLASSSACARRASRRRSRQASPPRPARPARRRAPLAAGASGAAEPRRHGACTPPARRSTGPPARTAHRFLPLRLARRGGRIASALADGLRLTFNGEPVRPDTVELRSARGCSS